MHANDALHETSADEDEAPDAANSSTGLDEVPGADKTVDELEGQLAGLQGAMDQVQSGDLDGAEASIDSLEKGVASGSEEE